MIANPMAADDKLQHIVDLVGVHARVAEPEEVGAVDILGLEARIYAAALKISGRQGKERRTAALAAIPANSQFIVGPDTDAMTTGRLTREMYSILHRSKGMGQTVAKEAVKRKREVKAAEDAQRRRVGSLPNLSGAQPQQASPSRLIPIPQIPIPQSVFARQQQLPVASSVFAPQPPPVAFVAETTVVEDEGRVPAEEEGTPAPVNWWEMDPEDQAQTPQSLRPPPED